MKRDETQRRYNFIKYVGITVLAFLMLVSIAGAAPFAYITNNGDRSVSIIDTATDTMVSTVPVGWNPCGVVVNPTGTTVYIANQNNDNISIINTSTNNVVATVNVDDQPFGIAITPDGKKVYVTNLKSNTFSVIDTSTNSVIKTVSVGSEPQGVVVTPDGTKTYVANFNSNTVSVIDTSTYSVIKTIDVGIYPVGIAVNPAGTKIYVVNEGIGTGTISVIDTNTNNVDATVNIEGTPIGVTVNPAGTKIYVSGGVGDQGIVYVVDTITYQIISTVNVGRSPFGIGVTPDGKKVYVANYAGDSISIIDTNTNKVASTVPVGNLPSAFGQFMGPLPIQLIYPIANFSNNITQGYAPLSVQFTDLSENAILRTWDFENDEIIDSTEETPIHMYANPGTYTVNLTAINENGTDSKTTTINVLKATPLINWGNPADIVYGTALGDIQLNAVAKDPVTGATVDGTFVYTPPTGTILSVGTQTLQVDFTPTDSINYTSESKEVTVNVLEKPAIPVADFLASPTTGKAPLTVTLTDKSTGSPTSWSWNFGDKSTSIDQSPVHTYSKIGKYTVKLTVKNAAGSSAVSKSKYITVTTGVVAPIASFTASPLNGNTPLRVTFADTSEGSPTSWKWSFGDGNTSTEQNPVNIFNKAGTYAVKLTVKNSAGSSSAAKSSYITILAPPVAAFSASPIKGKVPLRVTFTDKSKGSPSSWMWNFGDGNTSTEQNAINTYSKAGTYTVTLIANNDAGSNTVTKSGYIKVK